MQLVNLTEHPITVIRDGVVVLELPPGPPARLTYGYPWAGRLGSVNLVERVVRGVEGLPPPNPHLLYVVSVWVYEHCRERDDLVIPEFPIKNSEGKVIGCAALRTRRKYEPEGRRPLGPRQEGIGHERHHGRK